MMMAHTPGPWGIVFHGDVERIRLNGSTVYQVSDVTDPDFPSGQPRYCLDDLRLMAAAPEMLAALKCASADLEGIMPEFDPDGFDHPGWKTIAELRAAINKAEGRGE